jgi:hypothetical protein
LEVLIEANEFFPGFLFPNCSCRISSFEFRVNGDAPIPSRVARRAKCGRQFHPRRRRVSPVQKQTILCALPEIEQRRGLRKVIKRHQFRILNHRFDLRGQSMLKRLGFRRSNNVQAHGRRSQAAQMVERKQSQC